MPPLASSLRPSLTILIPGSVHPPFSYAIRTQASTPSTGSPAYVPVHKRPGWVSPFQSVGAPKQYTREELLSLSSALSLRDMKRVVRRRCPEILKDNAEMQKQVDETVTTDCAFWYDGGKRVEEKVEVKADSDKWAKFYNRQGQNFKQSGAGVFSPSRGRKNGQASVARGGQCRQQWTDPMVLPSTGLV